MTKQTEEPARSGDYHIYGRKSYTEPLIQVTIVQAAELTELAADRGDWVELIAFPEAAVIRVIPQTESVEA